MNINGGVIGRLFKLIVKLQCLRCQRFSKFVHQRVLAFTVIGSQPIAATIFHLLEMTFKPSEKPVVGAGFHMRGYGVDVTFCMPVLATIIVPRCSCKLVFQRRIHSRGPLLFDSKQKILTSYKILFSHNKSPSLNKVSRQSVAECHRLPAPKPVCPSGWPSTR